AASDPLPRAVEEGDPERPLSHGQRGIWFLQQLAPHSAAYHLSIAARLVGEIDTTGLAKALQLLVERHASLRTVFTAARGEPSQLVKEDLEFELLQVVLPEPPETLTERLHELVEMPFDLARGPLFRAALVSSPAGRFLVLVLHHIIADLWSLAVLIHDLRALYVQECGGPHA